MLNETKPWLGLVAAPLLFLSNLLLNFVLVPWVCGNAAWWTIHSAHLATLVLISFCVIPAFLIVRKPTHKQDFIAVLSLMMGAFSALALIAHWIPNFIVGACE